MAFSLTNVTTTAEVRAALGVSEPELPDAVLLVPLISTLLSEAMYDLNPQLQADILATKAITSPTEDQQRFVALAEAWSACWVAQYCLDNVTMFAPQVIKDTKTEVQRSQDAYKLLRRDVGATLGFLRVRLLTVYSLINTSAPAPTPIERIMIVTSTLGTDPVTGA